MPTIRLSRVIETTPKGVTQLTSRLTALLNQHEQIRAAELKIVPTDGRHEVVNVVIEYTLKPHEQVEIAKRWYHYKTQGWMIGFSVFQINEVTCVPIT